MTTEQKIKEILVEKYILNEEDPYIWEEECWAVLIHCPQYFKTNKYNWERYSAYIAEFSPQHLDTNKYNWEKGSLAVVKYCPEKLDIKKANLENIIKKFPQYKNMSLKEIKKISILNKV